MMRSWKVSKPHYLAQKSKQKIQHFSSAKKRVRLNECVHSFVSWKIVIFYRNILIISKNKANKLTFCKIFQKRELLEPILSHLLWYFIISQNVCFTHSLYLCFMTIVYLKVKNISICELFPFYVLRSARTQVHVFVPQRPVNDYSLVWLLNYNLVWYFTEFALNIVLFHDKYSYLIEIF